MKAAQATRELILYESERYLEGAELKTAGGSGRVYAAGPSVPWQVTGAAFGFLCGTMMAYFVWLAIHV
jgi:hypothetical protein